MLLIAWPVNASDLEKNSGISCIASRRSDLVCEESNTGEDVSLDSVRPVQTASVIKLTLMLQAFEQVKLGKLKLSAPVVLTKDNQVPGSGILSLMEPGLKLTLKDAITLMMVLSDNTATT